MHGALRGVAGDVAQGITQGMAWDIAQGIGGAIAKAQPLPAVGGSRGLLAPLPTRPGFPRLPRSPRWGFGANLPVGRAAPGHGDVPCLGEDGVQGAELTPGGACPRKTLPGWQKWESKVRATPGISPSIADPVPLLSPVSHPRGCGQGRGQGWGQGYFGQERWFSDGKRMGNPELPHLLGHDPAFSPDQPLAFLPAGRSNARPSCQ